MTGDFTRDSFEPEKNYTRVLMQQGRPQLDADWNEQIAIFWQYWRQFTVDLIGDFAGPDGRCGFGVITQHDFPLRDHHLSSEEKTRLEALLSDAGEFLITPGHYYVHGILCENHAFLPYSQQLHHSQARLEPHEDAFHLVYLDVWEHPVTYLDDDSIREPALNGIDTCVRSKVAWQVRTSKLEAETHYVAGKIPDVATVKERWDGIVNAWQPGNRGHLAAKAKDPVEDGAGLASLAAASEFGYRGPQNQLYRVEIHRAGRVGGSSGPTFKFSRENGSVAFPIVSIDGSVVTLGNLGRDSRFGLKVGDWVEVAGKRHNHHGEPAPLVQVKSVDAGKTQVALNGTPSLPGGHHPGEKAVLRRWDQKAGDPRKGGLELQDGAAILREGDGDDFWFTLENGIQIQFKQTNPANHYRTGDYWIIPARIVTGDVLWAHENGKPKSIPPHGVRHYYAPLAVVKFNPHGVLETLGDLRPKFTVPIEFGS
jgi:hypothetical protein